VSTSDHVEFEQSTRKLFATDGGGRRCTGREFQMTRAETVITTDVETNLQQLWRQVFYSCRS